MSAGRRRRLESVSGWVWDELVAAWEDGFGHLTTYVEGKGDARVPQSYRTAEGFRLGTWVAQQRSKKDTMSAERRLRLEALDGWVW